MKFAFADCPKELPSGPEPTKSNSFDELSVKQELRSQPSSSQVGQQGPTGASVWEGVLPTGFAPEFQKFHSAVSLAAERRRQNSAHFDNVAAAGWLSAYRRQEEAEEKARPQQPTLAEVVAASARRVPKSSSESLVRHTVGQARGRRVRETSLASSTRLARRTIAYTDFQPPCASARQSGLARRRQKSSHVEETVSSATASCGSQRRTNCLTQAPWSTAWVSSEHALPSRATEALRGCLH